MPTEITEKVKDGVSFDDFIIRALQGYLNLDKPIGDAIPLSLVNYNRYKEAINEFRRMTSMTKAEQREAYDAYLTAYRTRVDEYNERMTELRDAYKKMGEEVYLWQAPVDLTDFKEYCRTQLEESCKDDCTHMYYTPPSSVSDWFKDELESCREDVDYHLDKYLETVERVHGQNKLLKLTQEALLIRSTAIKEQEGASSN